MAVLVALLIMQAARTSTDAYVALWSTGSDAAPGSTHHGAALHHVRASEALATPYDIAGEASFLPCTGASCPSSALLSDSHLVKDHKFVTVRVEVARFPPHPVQQQQRKPDSSTGMFLATLAGLTGAAVVATVWRAFAFAYAGLRGAKQIHKQLLARCALLQAARTMLTPCIVA